ncbi:Aldo-ket-red domain-containing protein [Favolaschia claudopus]|uniref:Aldo-ket-red domain-containing protein n=1 Tax=Favolaschia claudopus TaxID=2862362 RepID=A0AAW0B533_9AGAR
MSSTPTIKLNNGIDVPALAFGTGTALYGKNCADSIKLAIQSGFTHLDGAQAYRNEEFLGEGVKASGKPRSELYIVTKLKPGVKPTEVKASLVESLRLFGLDFVDLFLIHTPPKDDTLQELWQAMEGVHADGLAKSIGVSNFMLDHLKTIMQTAKIVPAVNQIELHPYDWKDVEAVVKYGLENGVVPASYGGLSSLFRAAGGPVDQALLPITERLQKVSGKPVTSSQVLFKWLLHKGAIVVTTSSKEARIKEYLETALVPDLTVEEIQSIDEAGAKQPQMFFKR